MCIFIFSQSSQENTSMKSFYFPCLSIVLLAIFLFSLIPQYTLAQESNEKDTSPGIHSNYDLLGKDNMIKAPQESTETLKKSLGLYVEDNNTETKAEQVTEEEIYNQAVILLRNNKTDIALEKLFELLEGVEVDSEMTDKINISIAEGYRKRREFKKALALLYYVLKHPDIKIKDKTHAFTRLAAVYNEGGGNVTDRADSIVKYSNLSIANSKKYNFPYHLAISQNELGYVYSKLTKEFPKAIRLLTEALETFLSLDLIEDAANVSINLCNAYADLFDYDNAEIIIDKAINFCEPEGDIILLQRLYFWKSKICAFKNDYKTGYEYLFKSRYYNNKITESKISEKISGMAAKYETERIKKESELNLLKIVHKNNTIKYLSIGVAITLLLLIVIFYLFRKRTAAYKKLVEKNIALIEKEDNLHKNSKLLRDGQKKDEEATESHSREKELARKFERFMKNEKPYFERQISIDEVCTRLGTNRTYLASAIKSEFEQSFNSYINEARVNEAMRFLKSSEYDNFSVEGIGLQVGFNNRISFNCNFKKVTGVSPSVFRDNR